jgi:hypothetical protein
MTNKKGKSKQLQRQNLQGQKPARAEADPYGMTDKKGKSKQLQRQSPQGQKQMMAITRVRRLEGGR